MTITNLSSTIASALSGLNAAQAGIETTAHNIVNANTEGYSRKTISQESRVTGGQGTGVELNVVQRLADEFLLGEVRRQAAITGRSVTLETYHSRTQDVFGSPAGGLDIGSRIGDLSAALEAYGNDHQTLAFARDALNQAGEVAETLERLYDQVQNVRSEANREISGLVGSINDDLANISSLNDQIASANHIGDANPDLYDKRDLAIRKLAEKIEVDTYQLDDGALAVYTVDGQALVDAFPRVLHYDSAGDIVQGGTLSALSIFRQDQIDPTTGDPFNPSAGVELVSSGVRAELTPELQNDAVPDADQIIVSRLGGGQLQGLVEVRDRVLPDLSDQLGELAEGLRFALNAANNDSVAWPQPNALSGSRTDLSDFTGATRSGLATFAVTDAADGSTLLAFQIDVGAATSETDLINQINTNLGAFGTAAVGADGQLDITLAAAGQGIAIAEGDSSIQVTDAAGRVRDYGFSHYFGLNDILLADGPDPVDLTVRSDLESDPARLGSAKLDVTTPPLTATLGGPGDNRGANGLADALTADYALIARGQLPARTTDLGAYAAEIVAITAMDAARAEEQARADVALSDAVSYRADSTSGVNLDEELAALLALQQAYSVAARLITAVDEMLETLINSA